jgi:transketolase|uniref:transketolase n=1 Tax=Cephaloticoccus sp. TaxID=1985742 RepID=UPI00404B1620
MTLQTDILSQAANQARGLAIDAVHKAGIGHLGLALGCAEMGAVLYGHALSHNPDQPRWLNRDRFVLSAGHGSMFLYACLHLSGYDLSRDDLKAFRQLHSKTPGHPEFRETPGVEATTGPLGQGIGNAVGMAVAGKMAAKHFNTPQHEIINYRVVCLAGDGCMQEGVAMEAVEFAGHQQLDNLILIYDSNDVTLDAMADKTQSENTAARFKAIGWDVQTVDGHDMVAFLKSYKKAHKTQSGKPQLIIARTEIARGIPEVAGTAKGHGEGGAKFADGARAGLGLPADEHFFVSEEVRTYFSGHKKRLIRATNKWNKTYKAWRTANVDKAVLLDSASANPIAAELCAKIPAFPADVKHGGTRAAGRDVLQPLASELPLLIGGSADLYGSTLNYITDAQDFEAGNRGGRNIRFGIREHAMAAIANGMAYDGMFRPSVATFLVFADYSRPSMRLAALAKLPVIYIYTHDSIGVGEDGPTHQPVETISSLRVIPNFDVIRPGDAEEVVGAYAAALERNDGPTLIALSRQAVPLLSAIPVAVRRAGVLKGGYVAVQESTSLTLILLATGSELHLAVAAAKELGSGVRVVSLPSFERFNRQAVEYRENVLPFACQRRIAIEAGVTALWHQYVGPNGKIIGIDRFGLSAPGPVVFKELGITVDAILSAARSL